MTSSLLDRVKRQPLKTSDTFIAEAENAAPVAQTQVVAAPAAQATSTSVVSESLFPAAPARGHRATEDPRKSEVPRYTFNLRLNDYELELLRTLAEERRESMQKIVKAGLIPYLEDLRSKGT
jgi:hypothetical protein